MKFNFRAKACATLMFSTLLTGLPISAAAQQTPTAQTAALPAGIKKLTSVEGITEYQMANGMKVLLFPDQTKDSITVNITYLVGSRHENYGETGMAHLLEHLVFKGTPKHPNIPQELSSHGASPNGTTWFDRTNYFESFSATDENLNWALDLEADRMINSYIAKKDLESEFSVVRNELESGETNPFRVLWQRVNSVAFDWHNYSKSTIGARSDVENVPIERLQAFYKRFYQPDNAVLTVAGKIDEAKTLGLINKYFAPIPKPTRELQKIYTVEPVQDGPRTVTVNRVGDYQMVMAGYHTPSGSHPDYAALEVMNSIMTSAPSGRLYKALVESKKATMTMPLSIPYKDPGYSIYVAQTGKDKSVEDVRTTMIETIEKFAQTAPTTEEVERAKTAEAKNFDDLMNDPQSVALELSEWIARGDWRLMFLNRDRVAKVTAADVQRVAQKYFIESNRTLGSFVPVEKPVRAEVSGLTDEQIVAQVKDYKGNAVVTAGETFDPSPKNIDSRTQKAAIGNLKVAFLPKETRGDVVVASFIFRFGDEKSLMNRKFAAQFAGQMLMRGTMKHTRQQLRDEIDRLKAQLNVFGSPTNAMVSIQTTRQNLPKVLDLAAEILREPSFPAEEFELAKQAAITQAESGRTEPQAKAAEEMNKIFNKYPKGDIRYAETTDERIAALKAVTLDDAKKFYKDFYGASTGELAIVGDFDPKETQAQLTKLFGDWKSPSKFTRIPNEYFDIAAVNQSIETPDKANAFFMARLNIKLRDDNPDYPALTLGNYMFGGGFLNSRFLTRIRQKDGISYGGGSGINAGSLDESGVFNAGAIYAPQNVDKLEKGFREELDRVLKEGFTAQEVEDAKKGYLQQLRQDRTEDFSLAGDIRNNLYLNRTMAFDENFEKQLAALTVEQVNAAFRKYITPDKISIFKAGDFAKAKAATPTQ